MEEVSECIISVLKQFGEKEQSLLITSYVINTIIYIRVVVLVIQFNVNMDVISILIVFYIGIFSWGTALLI